MTIKERTYKINAFFDDANVVLRSLETKAGLPPGDLVLRGNWKKIEIYPNIKVDNYEIYSKRQGRIVGSLQIVPNPIGPNGPLFNYRELLQKSIQNHMFKAAFAGSGSITIV